MGSMGSVHKLGFALLRTPLFEVFASTVLRPGPPSVRQYLLYRLWHKRLSFNMLQLSTLSIPKRPTSLSILQVPLNPTRLSHLEQFCMASRQRSEQGWLGPRRGLGNPFQVVQASSSSSSSSSGRGSDSGSRSSSRSNSIPEATI